MEYTYTSINMHFYSVHTGAVVPLTSVARVECPNDFVVTNSERWVSSGYSGSLPHERK